MSVQERSCWLPEFYGTEPVPGHLKTSGAKESFLIMINYLINPGTIFSAAMGVAGGLSFLTVVLVQLSAVLLSMLAFLVMGRIGVDYGLTGQMACRAALGVRGGRWLTSPLRAICSIYWFAFQTLAGSMAIAAILEECLGIKLTLVQVSLPFAFLQVLVASYGYHWLKNLFKWALPLKLISLCFIIIMLWLNAGAGSVSFAVDGHSKALLIMVWFNGIFAGMLTMITDAADFTRYQKNKRSLWLGAMTGAGLGVFLGAATGAFAMTLVGGEGDRLFNGILEIVPGIYMALAILVLIVMDNWTINVINLYSGGLSLSHTLESLGRLRSTLLVSIPSVVLSCFPIIIHHFLEIATTLGMIFSAIAGVLLVDYWSRGWYLNVEALYQKQGIYWYRQGFRIGSIMIVILATALGYSLPEGWPPPLIAMLVAGVFYYSLGRIDNQSKKRL
ncbi:purine-cytosine permease family protein [Endozoicomonas arenosclerae]|uniref:purine-cytosine permease family protein n=1 Tax=Endozoicomonas arenosclerae TaxID=1633495 RepID=UPI000783D6C8|nr:cytosine permease [Endozoicomonas arenosclerae]